MKIEASHAHESRWTGSLSGQEIREILTAALVEALCPHHRYGTTLRVDCPDLGFVDRLPDVAFELVHDHDWHLKPDREGIDE